MSTIKRFITMLLLALLASPTALAQNPAQTSLQTSPSRQTAAPDVQIIIQSQQVRFTARATIAEMHLQVFDQTGELVFDSGPSAVTEINWPLHNASGAALKSGLYAYTLSVKEAGAEQALVRRGHFIVDRANDRDDTTDKLWVTSQNDNGVGTELTVARDEQTTIAGASAPVRKEGKERGAVKRDGEGEAKKDDKAERSALSVAGTGTPGQIAKFISEEEVGSSEIAELEGNVGVGTPAPATKLDVRGHLTLDAGDHARVYTAADGGDQNRFLLLLNSPSFASASGLKAGGLLVADSYAFASPGKNDLVVKGSVGIGTPAPESLLHLKVPSAARAGLTIDQTATALHLAPDGYSFRIRSIGQGTNQGGFFNFVDTHFLVREDGSVGIGTATPSERLDVAGNINYGRLTKLDVATSLYATIRAHDLLLGHPGRRGAPGRALVDNGKNELVINFGRDWTRTAVHGDLIVVGRTSTQLLEITGGADFAENFDINVVPESSAAAAKIEAGMVVAIDPANPGKLTLSAQAYDRRVAGIISGAGGVKPGMVMSQEGTLAHGKQPVALSGRVYAWVDAAQGAIEPGDLLTTSATAGHAMKVTDPAKAQGAIIGKAMTGLKEGRGLVLVLVTLQ